MSGQKIEVSALLASLKKEAKVEPTETRTLHDGTRILILVGRLPSLPLGGRVTWYPLVLRKDEETVDRREVEAILRHFWHLELNFFPAKSVKHSKSVLKRK